MKNLLPRQTLARREPSFSGLGGRRPGPEKRAVPQCWSVKGTGAGVPVGLRSWPEEKYREKKKSSDNKRELSRQLEAVWRGGAYGVVGRDKGKGYAGAKGI